MWPIDYYTDTRDLEWA